jgi:prolyl oligopeptidase
MNMWGKKTKEIVLILGLSLALLTAELAILAQTPGKAFSYPATRKVEQVDDYHGIKVADPYRWLENADSPETRAWIEAQNKLTSDYLATIPEREEIRKRLTQLWNFEVVRPPRRFGKHYFYTRNDGLQNQDVLYIADSIGKKGRVLFDPNALSKDGTVALSTWAVSEDGKLFAYGLRASGSDWTEFRVRNVETGKDFPEVLKNIKFSGASWSKDSKGFFYSRFPAPDEKTKLQATSYNQALYYHRVGTSQGEDVLVYNRPDDRDMRIAGGVTEDGKWLVIYVYRGASPDRMIYFKDLKTEGASVRPLVDKFEAFYSFIGNDGPIFYFLTNNNAPHARLVSVNIAEPNETWREIVPEAKETLNAVGFVNNQFAVIYSKDAYTEIRIYKIDGTFVRDVKLPGVGTAGGFTGRRFDKETFYGFSNYTTPNTIYRYDMRTGRSVLFKKPRVAFKPSDYEVKQVFYTSKDGTHVPMFIAHKKGLKLDGTNPTLLSAYGGFGDISQRPYFDVPTLVWMEMGGVYAAPNIRGGGEYGEQWHRAGMKEKKQNVFDDFIAAAEWLITNRYTQPQKLAIGGTSNGGLLIGAVLNQRPDLFGAALPDVGVMDMLRFHKFTVGKSWVSEYGSPEDPADFKAIYAYSPLHNIRRGTKYPAVLVTTADHDDRVVPLHSFKYTATLQEAQAGSKPILIRIETDSGHGEGTPTAKLINKYADKWAFLVKELDIRIPLFKG